MNEWKVGTNTHGRCSEAAVMGRLSISGFEKMIRKWGQKKQGRCIGVAVMGKLTITVRPVE